MPVQVVGTSAFGAQVLAHLSVICPCREAWLEADGTLALAPADVCTCGHGAGCNLVSTLVEGPESLRIAGPCCNSSFSEDHRTVYLCPDQQLPSCDGYPDAPPAVTLAHELTHALLEFYDTGTPNSEVNASRGENQIRKELGIAPRCCYTDEFVPLDSGVIDDEWEPSTAGCSSCADWEAQIKQFVWSVRWTVWEILQEAMGTRTCPTPSPQPLRARAKSPIDRRIDRVLRYRNGLRLASRVEKAARSLRVGPGLFVHLEQAAVDVGLRVVLIKFGTDLVTVVANVGADPTGSRLVPLGELVRFLFPVPEREVRTPSIPDFQNGRGGSPGVFDGIATSLAVQNGAVSQMTYYGYNQPFDPCVAPAPEDPVDRGRWEAVNQVMEFWIALSRETPLSVERA